MIYHCDRCQTALPGGATVCPACGKAFDNPVPAQTQDPPFADLLSGRTVGGTPKPDSVETGAAPLPGVLAPPPGAATSTQPSGVSRKVWLLGGLGLVAFLVLGCWVASALWMEGPGGEMEYRRHNLAGNAALERGDFQAADGEYGRMIALRPRRVDGYLLRAISEQKEGLYSASIADDNTALTLVTDPMGRGDLLHNRGEADANRGGLTAAVADFNQSNTQYALVRNPKLRPYIAEREEDNDRDLVTSSAQKKDYAAVVSASDALLAIGHPRPTDYVLRGQAEQALGRDSAAAEAFGRAVLLDPSGVIAYNGLAEIAEKKHGPAQAVAVYERAARAEPDDADIVGNLGWFQYKAGQTAAAIATDRRAASLDPSRAFIHYNMGLACASAGQGPQAQAAYAEALSVGTDADRVAATAEIHAALSERPASAALRQALAQVGGATGVPRPVAAAASTRRPAPRPPAAFADSLGPEVSLGDYGIQPPAGYVLTERPEVTLSSSGHDYQWTGPRRADGTAPSVDVEIIDDHGRMAAHHTSRQVTGQALIDLGVNHTHMTYFPVTACTVGGLPFARGGWQGTGVITGLGYEGAEYWSVSPSLLLHLSSHDEANPDPATAPLLRASILTFRRL